MSETTKEHFLFQHCVDDHCAGIHTQTTVKRIGNKWKEGTLLCISLRELDSRNQSIFRRNVACQYPLILHCPVSQRWSKAFLCYYTVICCVSNEHHHSHQVKPSLPLTLLKLPASLGIFAFTQIQTVCSGFNQMENTSFQQLL